MRPFQDEVSLTLITSAIKNEILGTVDNFVSNAAEWLKLIVVMMVIGVMYFEFPVKVIDMCYYVSNW